MSNVPLSKALAKTVWLLTDSKGFGGIESHIVALASGLRAYQIAVQVVLLSDYDQQSLLISQLQRLGIDYQCLNQPPLSGHLIARLTQLYQQAEQKPDIIHSHGYKASLLLRACRVLLQIPSPCRIATTFHAGEPPSGKVRLYDWLDRYSAFLSPIRIAVSQPIQDKLPTSSQRVNNFVANAQVSNGSNIAFVGRLSHEKGPDRYLKLAQLLPQHLFHVYGSGPMETQLQQQASENILFYGHQSDMEQIWQQVGLLVMTSRYEGLPMAALEAMMRGIPVVSFAVGEIPSLLLNGQNGWIAQDLDQMATQIEHYFTLPQSERQGIKQRAQATIIDHYSYQAVIPKLLQLYFGQALIPNAPIPK